jgi:prephenate dehydratase
MVDCSPARLDNTACKLREGKIKMARKIAFQGEMGAFSHAAALGMFPDDTPLPCVTFEQTISAVQSGAADFAVVPVENSLYGRITDIHHILPESGLFIVGEYFLPIAMNLLGVKGATLDDIKSVQSLSVALGQCRKFIRTHQLEAINSVDTAGSARQVAELGDKSRAAIASHIAAALYGLEVLEKNIEDADHNTTRFLAMSPHKSEPEPDGDNVKTTFVFRVRNVPAALYKAMGGFATNSVNMLKLESYMIDGSFTATQFYADIGGHPDDKNVQLAFEELGFFTDQFRILGVYPAAVPKKK